MNAQEAQQKTEAAMQAENNPLRPYLDELIEEASNAGRRSVQFVRKGGFLTFAEQALMESLRRDGFALEPMVAADGRKVTDISW